MKVTVNKYRVDPRRIDGREDVVDIITRLNDRLKRNENALRIGNTSIEDGDLTVRNGDIIFSESEGTKSMELLHGSIPEFRMYPLGVDAAHHMAMFGFDNGTPTLPLTALQIGIEKTDLTIDGGKVLLSTDYAILSYQPDGDDEQYLWFNIVEDKIGMRGSWIDQGDIDSNQALSIGSVDVAAGSGGMIWSYSTTMASRMAPVIGLLNTAGLVTSWNLTAMSTSGFTVTWSGTLAKTVNFWVFRV